MAGVHLGDIVIGELTGTFLLLFDTDEVFWTVEGEFGVGWSRLRIGEVDEVEEEEEVDEVDEARDAEGRGGGIPWYFLIFALWCTFFELVGEG